MQNIELARQILAVVDLIPYGRVASYGQVARLAGLPRHARMVAKVLQQTDDNSEIPWHRVVNAQGQIRTTGVNAKGENIQKLMLLEEGVTFKNNRIALKYFEW